MTTVRFGECTLEVASGDLEREGTVVRLQDLPLKILLELISRPGELVTREELIRKLWPTGIVDFDSSLNTAISKLRVALQDNAATPRYIETIPRKGYRFVGSVAGPNGGAVAARSTAPPSNEETRPPVRPARMGNKQWLVALSMGLFVVGAMAGYLWTRSAAQVRLAVMPFANLSSDPALGFFTDGMHEEVLGTLASRANMEVISRTTMLTYRDTRKTVGQISHDLGATHVLEGTVRREAESVRVTLQLVDARRDRNIWVQSYDERLAGALSLQARIAADVANQLSVKLLKSVADLPASANADSYDNYLRARLALQSLNTRNTADELARIKSWLDRAIALDSNYAAAYVERARVRLYEFILGHDLSATNLQALRKDLESARRLAGNAAEVLQVASRTALAVDRDLAAALKLMEAPQIALSKDPTVVLWRAFLNTRTGRYEEGLALYRNVARLDPGNLSVFTQWERELWDLGRPAAALDVARSFNEHGPGRIPLGELRFAFTGELGELRDDIARLGDSADADVRIQAEFDLLRYERRFEDLIQRLQQTTLERLRPGGYRDTTVAGLSRKPIASVRGWAYLLASDDAKAEREGAILRSFAAHEPRTKWNECYLLGLVAEGELFLANKAGASTAVRDQLAVLPAPNHQGRRLCMAQAARVLAWSGSTDSAVDLLEELATRYPMLGPAEITRDPLYSTPLAGNERYAALEKSLEAQIESNRKIFAGPNNRR